MEFLDTRVIFGGNHESISIHRRLHSKEMSSVYIEDFKSAMIDVLNVSIKHFLEISQLELDYDEHEPKIQRCIFSRFNNEHRDNKNYTLVTDPIDSFDNSMHEVLFVLFEGTDTTLKLFLDTIVFAKSSPYKFCLSVLTNDSLLPSDINTFRIDYVQSRDISSPNLKIAQEFWCLDEKKSLYEVITRLYQVPPDSVSFLLCWTYQAPSETLAIVIPKIICRDDENGKKYLSYLIHVNHGGKLHWNFEKRYSEFRRLHDGLISQKQSDPGELSYTF